MGKQAIGCVTLKEHFFVSWRDAGKFWIIKVFAPTRSWRKWFTTHLKLWIRNIRVWIGAGINYSSGFPFISHYGASGNLKYEMDSRLQTFSCFFSERRCHLQNLIPNIPESFFTRLSHYLLFFILLSWVAWSLINYYFAHHSYFPFLLEWYLLNNAIILVCFRVLYKKLGCMINFAHHLLSISSWMLNNAVILVGVRVILI